MLGYIAVFILSAGLSYLAISRIRLGSAIMQIIANALVSVGITGAVIVLALHRMGVLGILLGWRREDEEAITLGLAIYLQDWRRIDRAYLLHLFFVSI